MYGKTWENMGEISIEWKVLMVKSSIKGENRRKLFIKR